MIVAAAVDQASRLGLSGVTIGNLASELHMSKSGVVGPFGPRLELLCAALELDAAVATFEAAVLGPVANADPGPERLERLVDAWADYLIDCPFPGGCFITSASAEFDDRPGVLRDRLIEVVSRWRRHLASEIAAAQPERSAGQIDDLVTTMVGLSMAITQQVHLLDRPDMATRARRMMRRAAGLPDP